MLKFSVYIPVSRVHTDKIEIRQCLKDHEVDALLTRLKPMEIIKPSDPNSVVTVAITGGGRLLEVPTVRLSLGKFWCFV